MAGSRTYIPKLLGLLMTICVYITRYRSTIEANLPNQNQKDALAGVVAACELFTSLVDIERGD